MTIDQVGQSICWLASFPKSGNTWTRILLSNLLAPDRVSETAFTGLTGSISSNRPAFDNITGLPSSDMSDDEIDLLRPGYYREQAKHASEPLFVKVHDACHPNNSGEPIFPSDCSKGAIYLVRHPFDVAVSYAHHQGHQDYDRVVRQMNDPAHKMAGGNASQLRQLTMGWSGHFSSWHDQTAIPVLTIRYEDMLANAVQCLAQMAEFIGRGSDFSTADLERAAEASSFERLRQKEGEIGFRERPEKATRFFRSGRAGEGKEVLSAAQQEALVLANSEIMDRLGYEP